MHHVGRAYTNGVCPFLQRRGTASTMLREWDARGGLDERGLLVGYSSSVYRGADPVPCDLWVHHAFQGKTFFVLDALPAGTIVEAARLTFSTRSMPLLDSGVASNPCRYRIGTATGLSTAAYDFDRDASGLIATRATRPGNTLAGGAVDVTRSVAEWVNRGSADNWFVFSIEDGRALIEHSEDDQTAYCTMYVDDVALEVTALISPVP
ncbi:hypothetical protein G5B38_13035 [Pseudohalocynthiibacter aestuariivivens]|nr:hypothetical protein [Pseudohalocynthiibacter aestuariivivens]QIE46374.1 hypothetical protein G5B38_13035 [Pseudohalocynthiibacter aestuariivivens]